MYWVSGGVAFAVALLISLLLAPESVREVFSKVAPVATACVALIAALIAYNALHLQRDVARRRAAMDFFLKTEADETLIRMYGRFSKTLDRLNQITDFEAFKSEEAPKGRETNDYENLRMWLNVCELIAVGVKQGAFSETVSYDYWGYVLPKSYNGCAALIAHLRHVEKAPEMYEALDDICKEWVAKKKWRH